MLLFSELCPYFRLEALFLKEKIGYNTATRFEVVVFVLQV